MFLNEKVIGSVEVWQAEMTFQKVETQPNRHKWANAAAKAPHLSHFQVFTCHKVLDDDDDDDEGVEIQSEHELKKIAVGLS